MSETLGKSSVLSVGVEVGMFIKGKNMTQMSLFERAFGIRDFLQEIMYEEGDSRGDVMC